MGLTDRLFTLAERAVDRALIKAERAVGLETPSEPKNGLPPPPDALTQRGVPEADEILEFVKALAPSGSLTTANGELPLRDPKSLFSNPLEMVEQQGYKERTNAVPFAILARMARAATPIGTIVDVRRTQLSEFTRPQEDPHRIGFKIRKIDKKAPNRAAEKKIEELTRAILNCSIDPDPGIGQPRFTDFAKKIAWDSLVYDQGCAELIPTRSGGLHSWYAIDAATIRLADTKENFFDKKSETKTRGIQILGGQPINEYKANELMFWVRNPRTTLSGQGYGFSEVEDLTEVISSMIFGYQYNKKFFTQGAAPKGLLNFKGTVPGRQLAAFRKHFYAMISGVENAWRVPVVNAEGGVDWVNMQNTNRDMEFSAWMDFQLKLSCAKFLMDPLEIGFKYGNEGDRSLFESANQQKVTESKDRGLKPFVHSFERALNDNIISRLDPDFELCFFGLDALTPKELAELNEKRVATYLKVDEARRELGLEPLEAGKGDVILSGPWLQFEQAKMAQESQEKMAAQQGGVGGEAGPPQPGAANDQADESERDPLEALLDGADEKEAQKALVHHFEID